MICISETAFRQECFARQKKHDALPCYKTFTATKIRKDFEIAGKKFLSAEFSQIFHADKQICPLVTNKFIHY
jgi:hypothetical protein